MDAHEVIDSYVRDVARYLPRNKRNDVAFELRALLADELAAKAESAGRAPDRAMAMELLQGFGRPAEAAGRYHPRSPIIDPADNHNFVIWAVVGAIGGGALKPTEGAAYFRWLGVLVVVFALMGWNRRRNPDVLRWKPNRGPDAMPRGLALLALAATLFFPVFMYVAPQTFVKVAFFGAFPTGGLELTEAFRHSWQRAATLVGLGALVGVWAAVAVQGGWRSRTRWASVAAHAGLGVLCFVHAVPMMTLPERETFSIFVSPTTNRVAMPIFGLVGALLVFSALYAAYVEWARISPAPALENGPAT